MKRILLIFTAVLILGGCSNKEKEKIIELQNQVSKLKIQIDKCRNGADKMLAKLKIAFEKDNFSLVKSIYSEFENRHPETKEFKDAKTFYDKVLKIEEKKQKEAKRIAEEKRQKKLKALKKLKKKSDEVSGITWYYNPYFTHYNNTNLTSIYMGDKESTQPWLILKMSYHGDGWIFFEHAYLSYDGNTKEIFFNEYDDKETENSGGGVWEWIQVSVNSDLKSFLREFAKSKNAKMRLSGKYSETRTLTYNERKAILAVLNGYDALNEK